MFSYSFRLRFNVAGRIGDEHPIGTFRRYGSSLVTADLVVPKSLFSFSAVVSSNQLAVDSKSNKVKLALDKSVWKVIGLC
ncbi:hypothetical protein BC351_29055 [Paenibacillus ferrarius]|uniref:Uncharacterized protein n=1 Tax=Paenibacillus ferrarius TaxID=1469647 RepID=A0A1V4HJ90_9BACL|nr:hypothetical protein BC351_29055 [Paenibacillus ferrarius]